LARPHQVCSSLSHVSLPKLIPQRRLLTLETVILDTQQSLFRVIQDTERSLVGDEVSQLVSPLKVCSTIVIPESHHVLRLFGQKREIAERHAQVVEWRSARDKVLSEVWSCKPGVCVFLLFYLIPLYDFAQQCAKGSALKETAFGNEGTCSCRQGNCVSRIRSLISYATGSW